jgi:hypothetical protein
MVSGLFVGVNLFVELHEGLEVARLVYLIDRVTSRFLARHLGVDGCREN